MAKKDFSQESEEALFQLFSKETIQNAELKEKEQNKKNTISEDKENIKEIAKKEEEKDETKVTKTVQKNTKIKKETDKTPVIKKEVSVPAVKEEVLTPVVKKEIQAESNINKQQKIFDKNYRYSFYADPILNEYLSNITWLKRIKNIPPYLNSLIKADMLDFLNLPKDSSDEELSIAWQKYKKDINL